MDIIKTKVRKDQINTYLNLTYSNELNVSIKQLIKLELIKEEEDINKLSEKELLKIIRLFSNYNEPKFPGLKSGFRII